MPYADGVPVLAETDELDAGGFIGLHVAESEFALFRVYLYDLENDRNPYVDPMSLIQVDLLRRKRSGTDTDAVNYALSATINGIAAGLHNTG